MFETEKQKRTIQRWSRLAIQLNGAAESGRFDHVTTAVIVRELEGGRVFQFLERELPAINCRAWVERNGADLARAIETM